MIKQKRSVAEEYIWANRVRLITGICAVVVGILCGCIVFLCSETTGEMFLRLSGMIDKLTASEPEVVFLNAVKENLLVCVVFYIFSLFAVGEFLCPIYVLIRCISYGFSSCLIMNAYGTGGILIVALGIMPQIILYICAIIIFCVETSKQCRFIAGCYDKMLRKKSIFTYFATSLLPVFILLCGCLVEGFCAPHLILWCVKKI